MNNSTFTFAELTALAQHHEGWEALRDLLSIPVSDETVAFAGASSLLMRELAQLEDENLMVRSDVAELISRLMQPGHVINIAKVDPSGLSVSVALLPDDASNTFLVSLVKPGVYDLRILNPTDNPGQQLRDFVLAVAGENKSSLVIGSKDRPHEIQIGHDEGSWSLGLAGESPETHPKTNDVEAVGKVLDKWLTKWLTIPGGQPSDSSQ